MHSVLNCVCVVISFMLKVLFIFKLFHLCGLS